MGYKPGSSGGASTLGGLTNISASADALSASDKGRALIWDGVAYVPDNVGLEPHVVSQSPIAFIETGSATITINGVYLNSSCRLTIPTALGTVVSGPVLTNVTTTSADATWTLNINAIPDPAVEHILTLANGGHPARGMALSVYHGWSPISLVQSGGGFWDANAGITYGIGTKVASWAVVAGDSGILYKSSASGQPSYVASGINGLPSIQFGPAPGASIGFTADNVWSDADTEFTIAMVTHAPTYSGAINGLQVYVKFYAFGSTSTIYWATSNTSVSDGNLTTPRSYVVTQTGSTNPESNIYENNVLIKNHVGGGSDASYPNGNAINAYNSSQPMYISQIIYVKRVLSSAELAALDTYWTNRYGI